MIKSSLVNLINEKQPSPSPRSSRLYPHSQPNTHKVTNLEHGNKSPAPSCKKNSKIIKITQFNSSLLIGDQRLAISGVQSANSSPHKNFTIKKVNEFKSRVIASAQKAVQIQLRRKQQEVTLSVRPSTPPKSPRKSLGKKRSIDKLLVATKCSINNQNPILNQLIDCNQFDIFGRRNSIKKVRNISDLFQLQRMECSSTFKDLLAQTNESIKQQDKELAKESNISFDCEEQITEQLESPLLQRTRSPSPRKKISRHIMEQKKHQENLQKEKKEMLELKKQLNKNYAKPFNPPDNISAQAYIIYETNVKKVQYNRKVSLRNDEPELYNEQRKMLINSHKVIASLNPRVPAEVASLTKIMTCILTIEIAQQINVSLPDEIITVGLFEQSIGGTSANIKKGQIYTVEQLLFGLMLPSGNDASLALAVWGGRKLIQHQANKNNTNLSSSQKKTEPQISSLSKRECYNRFLEQMNNKANQLNMQKTWYANSHGLANIDNKSCPFDIAILSQYAMNNHKFRQIVSTKRYECNIRVEEEEQTKNEQAEKTSSCPKLLKKDSLYDPTGGLMEEQMKDTEQYKEEDYQEEETQYNAELNDGKKMAVWQNTHLLMQNKSDLYVGIKTGVTMNAGPCLASCLEFNNRRFIIVVLNCKTMKFRFRDTENLRKWLFCREEFKYKEREKKINQDS